MRVCKTDRLMTFLYILINQVHMYPHVSFERTCTYYYFVFLISMSKRRADNNNLPQVKHKLTGFSPEWGRDIPFVLYTDDASGAGGMFCSAVGLSRQSSEEELCKLFKKSRVHKILL